MTGERVPRTDHAVVLGASIAGLLTARVLAEQYRRVTVVERDRLDSVDSHPRRGVPQGAHAHGLLAAGLHVLEELLPGATADLVAGGAPAGDVLGNVRFCPNGHRLKQVPVGLRGISLSRPYLEEYIRSRVAGLAGVTMLGGHDVVGIEPSADGGRIVGARVQRRKSGSVPQTLSADLVVDATGRGSRTPRWLRELGYQPPPEETLRVDVGYSSRHFRIDANDLDGDIAIIIGPTLEHPRGGALQLQEGGRAIVTLFGMLGDHPPTDDGGFEKFAGTLPLPFIADAIRGNTALDQAVLYRYPASTRHRFDRLRRFPGGYVVIGDALCSFNPMYGQGMSVAALEVIKLRDELTDTFDALRFFRAVKPIIDIPWQIATGSDLAFPAVEGSRDARVRSVNWYLSRLHAAAEYDDVLSRAFIRVTNLLSPPPTLMRPSIAMRVWRGRQAATSARHAAPASSGQ